MGLFDYFNKDRELILKVINLEKWPIQLIKQRGLDSEISKFLKRLQDKKKAVNFNKAKLSDPNILNRIPARARSIYDEHSKIIMKEVDTLLEKADFIDDLFLLNTQKEEFTTLLTIYRDVTRKSFSALKEFIAPQLQRLSESINELEDEILALDPLFERTNFYAIVEVKKLIDDYRLTRGKASMLDNKNKELDARMNSLYKKKNKIEDKISYYKSNAKGKSKDIIALEEELLQRIDDVKKGVSDEKLQYIESELLELRKKMIQDITAMNINEQRRFLEGVNQELEELRDNSRSIGQEVKVLSLENTINNIKSFLENFKVRFEDGSIKDILE